MQKLVYSFNEGSKDMKSLLGGKGANLSEMTKIGLRVPFGFIVATEACSEYYAEGKKLSENLITEIEYQMEVLEHVAGKKFGDRENPLLVSVRSGADISMAGMIDTILNLGLNDETVEGLAVLSDNPRFAYDSYRRFIQNYGESVLGIPKEDFATIDADLSTEDLQEIIEKKKTLIREYTGKAFPQEPGAQLMSAIEAVFRSWNPGDEVPSVVVQIMVFGNMGEDSGVGMAYSRNPVNGTPQLFGEFLFGAQGPDLNEPSQEPHRLDMMKDFFPESYLDLQRIAKVLESHYKDMQQMEFTIEQNKLYVLQTKTANRTAECSVKAVVDMVNEGLISQENAIERMDVNQIDHLIHPAFEHEAERKAKILAKGLPASPGAASGRIYFRAEDVVKASQGGIKAILVRQETSPEDLAGLAAAEGVLTAKGGMTSHAAVVTRGMGKCCVAGCGELQIDERKRTLTIGETVLSEGDGISLNGTMGHVYFGEIKNVETSFSEELNLVMSWADEIRSLKVRANADTPAEAKKALKFGAEGIGLCRTEHMFYDEARLPLIRQMIMSQSEEERRDALNKLLPYQKEDFKQIYEVMEDKPITIRLLDPPLNAFLPHTEDEMHALAETWGISYQTLERTVNELEECNPMLGQRGCRVAVAYPEIAEMQTRAMIEAAIEISQENGIELVPEIMIPLVGIDKELANVKATVEKVIAQCKAEYDVELDYFIGTMIEVPRAAVTAGEIAKEADFFSFGTNDLTQLVFGFSRDDTGKLIAQYVRQGILTDDPFQTIDQKGVGSLMETAVKLGRQVRPNLKVGICGEHGGDPRSIEFCHRIGLQYVSCSPYRMPVARIAAAQAALKEK